MYFLDMEIFLSNASSNSLWRSGIFVSYLPMFTLLVCSSGTFAYVFPYLPLAVLMIRSRLGSEYSLVCNWYSYLLLDDINDCKMLPVCCHNSTATSFGAGWGDRQWKTRPMMSWELFPKQCHGYDSSQHPYLAKENALPLESWWRWDNVHHSVILSLIQESPEEH